MNYTVSVIDNLNDFYNFESKWKEFENISDNSYLSSSFNWLQIWWNSFSNSEDNTFGYHKKILILCLYENDKLIAIAPFIKLYRKKFGIKVSFIEFFGQQYCCTYFDIIGKNINRGHRDFLFDWLDKNVKYDLLFLKYIPEGTKCFNPNELFLYSACPRINLSDYTTYDDYTKKNYSLNLKQNLKKTVNKIAKEGSKTDNSIEPISDENSGEIVRISKTKLQDDKECVYLNDQLANFFISIYKKLESSVFFIKINNKNVAYRTNIHYRDTKYCIDVSYDREYRKYAVGNFALHLDVEDSFRKKISFHCFGPGIDEYKCKFTKDLNKINIFIKKGNSILSYLLFPVLKILVLIKEKKIYGVINKYHINENC